MNNYPEAEKNFKKALAADPDFLEALSNYAQLMERISTSQAIKLWQTYLMKAQNKPKESQYLSFARKHLQKLRKRSGESP